MLLKLEVDTSPAEPYSMELVCLPIERDGNMGYKERNVRWFDSIVDVLANGNDLGGYPWSVLVLSTRPVHVPHDA